VRVAAASRPLWLPNVTPPAYLNGSLAGDFGFDPLGLGADPQRLKWCAAWIRAADLRDQRAAANRITLSSRPASCHMAASHKQDGMSLSGAAVQPHADVLE
jgi:hypothetical protein